MTRLTRRQVLAYEARRVAQTRQTFTNWPALLTEMVGEEGRAASGGIASPSSPGPGHRLTCPNVPGARLPMYEQFADDCYDLALAARHAQ